MLTKELQLSFNRAVDEAINRRHEYISLEHLLYALLQERTAPEVIRHCGGNVDTLRRDLEQYLTDHYEEMKGEEEFLPEQTAAFKRVVQRAVMHAQASGQKQVNSGDILASIFLETNSNAK